MSLSVERVRKKIYECFLDTDYGRTMKAFFIEISNCWAWANNLS